MHEVYIFSTNPTSNKGGIASATASFIVCLKNQGIKTKEFTTHEPSASKLKNCAVFFIALLRFVCNILFKHITFQKLPIVYTHVGPKGSLIRKLLIAAFARTLGVKVFTHHHSADFRDYLLKKGFWSASLFCLSKISHKNFVLSKWWNEIYRQEGINNTSVVPNCLPITTHRSHPGNNNTNNDEQVILSIGRLAKGKNFDLVINSIANLPTNVKVKIAGDGPELQNLINLSNSYISHQPIQFLGWVDEIEKNQLYAESDLFVLPSNYDSFGMVYIESLSHGCPVVIGPNPAVMSALDGLDGVFKAVDFSPSGILKAIITGLSCEKNKQAISESCMNRYGLQPVSVILIEALELTNEKD